VRGSGSGRPIYRADAPGATRAASSTTRRSSVRAKTATASPLSHSAGPDSPDGRKIAFTGRAASGNVEIYVVNPDGSGQRNLTRDPGYEGDPAWSPDRRKIAFAKGSRSCRAGEACVGNPEIYVMNTDGSEQRNLTRSPTDEGWFAWSPVRTK
jgi:Tol biopolymer transport system component